jgi:hypothetical protein
MIGVNSLGVENNSHGPVTSKLFSRATADSCYDHLVMLKYSNWAVTNPYAMK